MLNTAALAGGLTRLKIGLFRGSAIGGRRFRFGNVKNVKRNMLSARLKSLIYFRRKN